MAGDSDQLTLEDYEILGLEPPEDLVAEKTPDSSLIHFFVQIGFFHPEFLRHGSDSPLSTRWQWSVWPFSSLSLKGDYLS